MKILLYGASGMLGSAVREELFRRDHSHLAPRHRGGHSISDRVDVDLDLTWGPEVVINCAGVIPDAPGRPAAQDADIEMVLVNALGPQVLAQLCRERGVRLVHVSTDCVFSGAARRLLETTSVADTRDIYGRSKLVGETLGPILEDRAVVVRTSFVGPQHGLLRWLLDQAQAGHVNGYRSAWWTGSTVWEVARGIVDLAEDPTSHGIVHLATERVQRKHDVLVRLAEILHLNVAILPVESPYINRALWPTHLIRDLSDPAVAEELARRTRDA